MENKRVIYDFCPKCSGLMKNGVCIACGYEKKANPREAFPDRPAEDGHTYGSDSTAVLRQTVSDGHNVGLQTPKHKISTGLVVGSCVGGLCFILILCLAVYLIVNDLDNRSRSEREFLQEAAEEKKSASDGDYGADEDFGTYGNGGLQEDEGYVPDPSDEFYVEITDALRDDLFYQVEWQEYEAESEDGTASFYTVFPVLAGDVANTEMVNQLIEATACRDELLCQQAVKDEKVENCYIQSIGYVTYMDGNVISIVFQEYIYLNDVRIPRIYDINVDVGAGSVLAHQNMVDYSPELVQRVRAQNAYQNSVELDEMPWTDTDMLELLKGDSGVVFYTPVGLEVGFNYGDSYGYGWLTVTFKE